jgi:hypothetical protein
MGAVVTDGSELKGPTMKCDRENWKFGIAIFVFVCITFSFTLRSKQQFGTHLQKSLALIC